MPRLAAEQIARILSDPRLQGATGLTQDSRAIQPGFIFLACAGLRQHGLDFLDKVVSAGAIAVLWEASLQWTQAAVALRSQGQGLAFIEVPGLTESLGDLASAFFGHPSQQLDMIGITGTNGKTSCTQFIAHALSQSSVCGMIGTLGLGVYPNPEKASMTTPDAVTLQQTLFQLCKQQAQHVVMEVSSHALDQQRVQGVAFDIAVLTNITRDHLDYHGDMAHYTAAKLKLFSWPGLKAVVVNLDDPQGNGFLSVVADGVKIFTLGMVVRYREDYLQIHGVALTEQGIGFSVSSCWGEAKFSCALYGQFNVVNVVTALAVLLGLGLDFTEAVARLQNVPTVPGRLELMRVGGKPKVFVDYAHTPDALQQSLSTLKKHFNNRIICVFGCGGDRDRGKRPLMGKIAEQYADQVVLTDDNPRSESGDAIIQQILSGITALASVRVERDRCKAIAWAISIAAVDDVVLVAGKGHEDYQIIGNDIFSFSDREVVKAELCRQ